MLSRNRLSHDWLAAKIYGQVKLLVEEGDADIMLQDRWQHTALDEANRLGARSVAKYLKVLSQESRIVKVHFCASMAFTHSLFEIRLPSHDLQHVTLEQSLRAE